MYTQQPQHLFIFFFSPLESALAFIKNPSMAYNQIVVEECNVNSQHHDGGWRGGGIGLLAVFVSFHHHHCCCQPVLLPPPNNVFSSFNLLLYCPAVQMLSSELGIFPFPFNLHFFPSSGYPIRQINF
jgi:hypothetical protein